jgi:hypothetical protein
MTTNGPGKEIGEKPRLPPAYLPSPPPRANVLVERLKLPTVKTIATTITLRSMTTSFDLHRAKLRHFAL